MAESFLEKKYRQIVKADWQGTEGVSTASPLGAPVSKDSARGYIAADARLRRATRGTLWTFAALAGFVFVMISFVGPSYLASGTATAWVSIVLFLLWLFCLYKFLTITSFLRWASRQKK